MNFVAGFAEDAMEDRPSCVRAVRGLRACILCEELGDAHDHKSKRIANILLFPGKSSNSSAALSNLSIMANTKRSTKYNIQR